MFVQDSPSLPTSPVSTLTPEPLEVCSFVSTALSRPHPHKGPLVNECGHRPVAPLGMHRSARQPLKGSAKDRHRQALQFCSMQRPQSPRGPWEQCGALSAQLSGLGADPTVRRR